MGYHIDLHLIQWWMRYKSIWYPIKYMIIYHYSFHMMACIDNKQSIIYNIIDQLNLLLSDNLTEFEYLCYS